ncbi:MAG: bifunctional phosphoribosyl-AMP cyclohydrolase/phosphoribosyl-ATP diphosphatase HisIE [Algicola sp.]|nr:bifunctional phosphoribosyl-AMP cyclohydrolase/phosphoribosyl-ATP diphosphatase HisIE [Algicola sp.]
MIITQQTIKVLAWDKMDGMIPAIVQHQFSGKVLMQGYMNKAAIEKTLDTGLVTFYRRSKDRLWTKGEESGNSLKLLNISTDCDNDSIIALADPIGPTCHLGTETCWANNAKPQLSFLAELEQIVKSRKGADKDTSYTASLFESGIKRIAQKVGEEGVETALAEATGDIEELKNESADLLFHLLVLLQSCDTSMSEVIAILQERHKG